MLFLYVTGSKTSSVFFLKKTQPTVEKPIVLQHVYLTTQLSFVITRYYSVLWRWWGRSSSDFSSEKLFLNGNFPEIITLLRKSGNFFSRLIFCIFLFLDLRHNNALYLIKIMNKFWPLSYCCACCLYIKIFCLQEFNYLACSSHSNIPQAIVYINLAFVLSMSNFVESFSFPLLFMLVLTLQSTACLKLAFFFSNGNISFYFHSVVLEFLQCWWCLHCYS